MLEQCHVCGGELAVRFPQVADTITGETFAIRKCLKCGLGHTAPQPEDIRRYYGEAYYGNRHGMTGRYCIKRRLAFIDASTKRSPGGKLLDVGCGDGSFLVAARDDGWRVAGIELNPATARKKDLDVYENIEQASSAAPFDCITMWHSLEHMHETQAVLHQLSALLKPDGTLLIAIPDNRSFQSCIFKEHWIPLDVPRHLYHFDLNSLACCLGNAELSIQRKWHTELEYDLMGWSQSALNGLFSTPNVFLDLLAGKPRKVGRLMSMINFALGTVLTVCAVPMAVAEACLRRGGTLIVAAKPR